MTADGKRTVVAWSAITIGAAGCVLLPGWRLVVLALDVAEDLAAASTTIGTFGLMVLNPLIVAFLLLQLLFVALVVWGVVTLLRGQPGSEGGSDTANADKQDFRRFLGYVTRTMAVLWLAATGLCTTAVFLSPSRLGREGTVLAILIVGVSVIIGASLLLFGRWLRPNKRPRNV